MRAHLDGPLRFPELRERIGGGAQTTLRGQIDGLRQIGALLKCERSGMPYTVENELTDAGRALISAADVLEAWLARAPQGPIALGSEQSKAAIRALIGGWGSTMLRALAARPLSLTELDGVISQLSYPAIERRLAAMRAARQVEQSIEKSGARPYAVTPWARQAVGPLAVAGRCECRHLTEEAEVVTRLDIEAAFLLAVPLITLSNEHTGPCLLAVDSDRLAGVRVEVSQGDVTSCVSRLEEHPGTWALGSVEAWLGALIEGRQDDLRLGGDDPDLARAVIARLHRELYAP